MTEHPQQTEQPTGQPTEQPTEQSGQQTPPPPPPPYAPPYAPPYSQQYAPPYRRLTRTSWDAPISGVCGGLAVYLGLDPTLVRVLAVLAAVFTFPVGVIAYVVMWAVIPRQ